MDEGASYYIALAHSSSPTNHTNLLELYCGGCSL